MSNVTRNQLFWGVIACFAINLVLLYYYNFNIGVYYLLGILMSPTILFFLLIEISVGMVGIIFGIKSLRTKKVDGN